MTEEIKYTVIIPVYNRPEELKELLGSISLCLSAKSHSSIQNDVEIIIVEDGSRISSKGVVKEYESILKVKYLEKANGGPASARNYGAKYAEGEYLIFLDSDTILPKDYFINVDKFLSCNDVDLFGGPDMASCDFTSLQKAISYSMTSFFTTGGIRGGKRKITKFIPRSFNMGVKKSVFDAINGFSDMRFGEDMDFSMRIIEKGYTSALIPQAAIYHKRRTSISAFYKQVFNSGRARVELSLRHKSSLKLVHLLPLLFTLYLVFAFILSAYAVLSTYSNLQLVLLSILLYALLILIDSTIKNKSIKIGLLSVLTSFVQLIAYGLGFINNTLKLIILHKTPQTNIDNDAFYK